MVSTENYLDRGFCWRCACRKLHISPEPRPVKRHKPDRYQRLVNRVWRALESAGPVFYFGTSWLSGRCPVCRTGVVGVLLIRTEVPEIDTDGCSAGCTAEQLAKVLK
jgi:hypothetical protein